jgi:hypothetical protein
MYIAAAVQQLHVGVIVIAFVAFVLLGKHLGLLDTLSVEASAGRCASIEVPLRTCLGHMCASHAVASACL